MPVARRLLLTAWPGTARARAMLRVVGVLAMGLAAGAQGADDARLQRGGATWAVGAAVRADELRPLLAAVRDLEPLTRVQAVNTFYNARIRFAPDEEIWGQPDHWASPLELLARGAGDCEDYAIAKYFTLLALGVPEAHLRLVYVRARLGDGRLLAHMVLAWYPAAAAEPLLLDNLMPAVEPVSRRPDLAPVFSFNADGLYPGLGAVSAGLPAARLAHWGDVLRRAQAEGFI